MQVFSLATFRRVAALALLSVGLAIGAAQAQSTAPLSAAGQAAVDDVISKAADDAADAAIAANVHERFVSRFPGAPVTDVRATPYGLYEVNLGGDLVYTDEAVRFVLDGTLIDAETRRDVTRARKEELSRIAFDDLPLALALKQVKGKGERRIAIFEDPNCGYCKQFRRTLEEVDNLTVHTFLLPILSPDSHVKVRDVWCSKSREKTWDDWMLRGKVPPAATCDDVGGEVVALAQKLMVRGTPAIFFDDGSRANGALSLDAFKTRLDAAAQAAPKGDARK
ncbi:Thiol:disulfide interchange protein DsbC [plant metagenome]|uniref:Thiol:disulfide interchange protein DsbC n=1 Tax=plant metagenome TaxID=1297885 RepID=A0A484PPB4_9ZZZZ